jgi:apolipoprotein N-acyltransferase
MRDWINLLAAASPRRRALLALLSGSLSALAMPPLGAVPVYFLTFPGLILLLRASVTGRQAFAVGWCFGFGFHLIGLYWISFALFTDIGRFWWALPFSAAGLPVVLAFFAGLAGFAYHRLKPAGLLGPLALATVWTTAELLRGYAFTGFPWNLPAYAWAHVLPVWQGLALGGAYGLSFFTVFIAALPALLFFDETPRRRAVAALAFGGVLTAALAGWGAQRLATTPTDPVPGVRLRLVQPNIPQSLKWEPGQRRANFFNHLELTAAPTDRPPTVVIWAETAAPFFIEREPQARSMIAAALPEGAQSALIGAPAPGPASAQGEPRLFYNTMTALDRDGNVIGGYAKHHLVPFGEYMPLRRLLPVEAIAGDGGEYAPGPGPRTLTVPGAPPVSPLICYEAIFPGRVTDDADRPQWLLNLTNDAWYGMSAGPYQHLAISAARAVEEGLPLVRVANTGISAVVDAYGRTVAALPLGARGALDSDLPRSATASTVFSDWRSIPLVALIIFGWLTCALNPVICSYISKKPYK